MAVPEGIPVISADDESSPKPTEAVIVQENEMDEAQVKISLKICCLSADWRAEKYVK